MDRKKLLIIIGCVVFIFIVVGVIVLVNTCSNDDIDNENMEGDTSLIDQRRLNKLRLAETYLFAGEYDMALNLINELLIENFDDEDAHTLQRIILGIDRSGGADALMEAQKRLLEEQLRQTRALVDNMNRNNPGTASSSTTSGQSAADAAAARRAAEEEAAARRAAEQAEEARRAAEAEQMRLGAQDSLQSSTANTSQGISSGAESVKEYDSTLEMD
jgi:hypothetical protein